MRVLVACEFSGVVRDAFLAAGHDAVSCDFLPTESPGPHYQGDVRDLFDPDWGWSWDLLVAFPPCTYLASSGLHWNRKIPGRAQKTEDALDFVRMLLDASVPRVAIENPVGCISTRIRKPDQIIQPWQFGHPHSKTTCLWLRGLPKLQPTDILPLPPSGRWENQSPKGQNRMGGKTKNVGKKRSVTYTGIAQAMAAQWGSTDG